MIESLIQAVPDGTTAGFYRTAAGAEIDLVLDFAGGERWAIEVKRSSAPRLEKGFLHARADIEPDRAFVVHAGSDRWPMAEDVEAIGLRALCEAVGQMT